ncbi:hypothetical protein L7F22_056027 [Adiantum nelumboides]|nr:hypothetical protein [Adiantum nelumboides]
MQQVAMAAPLSSTSSNYITNADIMSVADQRQALPEDAMAKIQSANKLVNAVGLLINNATTTTTAADRHGAIAAAACSPSRFAHISMGLSSVGELLLSNLVSKASLQVDVASTALSACQSAVGHTHQQSTNILENNGPRAALAQAISLLQAASISLHKLQSLPHIHELTTNAIATGLDELTFLRDLEFPSLNNMTTTSTSSNGCWRDGTSCQFSECGRGKRLPMCAMGFAYGVTGGAAGLHYIVTRDDDDFFNPLPGSLRYGVCLGGDRTSGGVWITFERSMVIHLKAMLWIRSYTTVDGRGANITINDELIAVDGATNVILHNFQINNVANTDTIHIFGGSTKVWVDHITSFNAIRGLISVLKNATDVTISNCKLSNKNFNMLLGASDKDIGDKNMRVTVYRNWFKDSTQRMPHCRWGFCHVVNNLYTNWGFYAIGGRVYARILSERNAFIAGNRQEVTPWFFGANSNREFDDSAAILSQNDLFLNGSTFHQFYQPFSSDMTPPYASSDSYPPFLYDTHALPDFVHSCSGAIFYHPIIRQCRDLAGFH